MGSPNFKEKLSPEALALPSLQRYREICQDKLNELNQAADRPAARFQLDRTQAINNSDSRSEEYYLTDGRFYLANDDPGNDFYCAAQINAPSREMDVIAGRLSIKANRQAALFAMPDQCAVTRAIFGDMELGDRPCVDGVADLGLSLLYESSPTASLKKFHQYCAEKFQNHTELKLHTSYSGREFDMDRVQVVDEFPQVPEYLLQYKSPGNHFFCEGKVDVSGKLMVLRGGNLRSHQDLPVEEAFPMADTCSLTQSLFGEKKFQRPCEDMSLQDKQEVAMVGRFLEAAGWTLPLGLYGYMKGRQWAPLLARASRMPHLATSQRFLMVNTGMEFLLRNLGFAYLAGRIYDSVVTPFISETDPLGNPSEAHPLRVYGKPVAEMAGLTGTLALESSAGRTWMARQLAARPALAGAAAKLRGTGYGLLAVAAFDWSWGNFVVADTYNQLVERRATDQVYDQEVYHLDAWDFMGAPLLLKGVRASCRAIAPQAMNWAVAKGNGEVREAILREDREVSQDITQWMREVLPLLAQDDPAKTLQENLKVLSTVPPFEKTEDSAVLLALQYADVEQVRDFYLKAGGDEQNFNQILKSLLVKRIQEDAQVLVLVNQSMNDWAREVFHPDGTLIEGMEKRLYARLGNPRSPLPLGEG